MMLGPDTSITAAKCEARSGERRSTARALPALSVDLAVGRVQSAGAKVPTDLCWFQQKAVTCQPSSANRPYISCRRVKGSVMSRSTATLVTALILATADMAAPATGQSISVAPPPPPQPPIFVTTLDWRLADIEEQRLEIERQRAEAEARRAEAEEHRRSVEAQTPKGQPSIATYSGLAIGNPLAGTDAPRCILGNGGTIQVSGILRNDSCQK
jgi:hypothetical protein